MKLTFTALPDDYAITRLSPDAGIPAWLDGPGLVSMARADDELSLVCRSDRVPSVVQPDSGWSALRVDTLANLDEAGVVMAAVTPISTAGLGVFVISTHLRDYILVRISQLPRVRAALTTAGHSLV